MNHVGPIPIVSYAAVAAWRTSVSDILANALAAAVAARGEARLLCCGGRTAATLLPGLAAHNLPWRRIVAIPADERCAPLGHDARNSRLIRDGLPPETRICDLLNGATTCQAADLDGLAARLARLAPDFDVAFLGMGEDGHIASLFPREAHGPGDLIAVRRPDYARVSLSASRLKDARLCVLGVLGATKAEALHRALRPDAYDPPPVRDLLIRTPDRPDREVAVHLCPDAPH